MNGGTEAWVAAGLPVYGAQTEKTSTASKPSPRKMPILPERISAAELKRLMMDLPGTFDLVDIRPAGMFADYNLAGSQNADIADLISNPAYLVGAGPLIIVDRDGSLAMAAGGILSQKTQRPIKVLYGGLDAYWKESELGPIAPSTQPEIPASSPRPVVPASPAAPQTPKKTSAGC